MNFDIDKLRREIRQNLDTEELLLLLDRAIELIEADQLPQLFKGIVSLDSVQEDETTSQSLLQAVEEFRDDSISGIYYESFRVNSHNFMDKSNGTLNWIDEFDRLMKRCLEQCNRGEPAQCQQIFEILFELLDEIDKGGDTIIFFADEAGSWQVGVDWEDVLPSYFAALAQVVKPKSYAQKVMKVVTAHVEYDRDRYHKAALSAANPAQRKALKALI